MSEHTPDTSWRAVKRPNLFKGKGHRWAVEYTSYRIGTEGATVEIADWLTEDTARLIAAASDMLAALGPMRIALQKQVDLLRFQARNSTAGLARTLIETAEEWQALCDNAEAALAKATVTGVAS